MSTTKKLRATTRKRRCPLAPCSAKHVVKAYAIVNDETGRIMLTDLGLAESWNGHQIMETPCIYMTRAAAEHYRRDNERIVRVAIQEIRPNIASETRGPRLPNAESGQPPRCL